MASKLKHSNIMVCEGGATKVMDFDIAHQSQSLSGLILTSASGAPPYMAPEQGLGSASPASDIYSLGVVTYEMLTGQRPSAGPDLSGDKLAEKFTPPSAVNHVLPQALDEIIVTALKADPTKRPSGTLDLLRMFDERSKPRAAA